jgi:hypothetical protein
MHPGLTVPILLRGRGPPAGKPWHSLRILDTPCTPQPARAQASRRIPAISALSKSPAGIDRGRFGAAASEYQQALAMAASTEKDQAVKDEIERALTAITTPAKQ